MSKFVWLQNPYGREVEVDGSKLDEFLDKGFKLVDNPAIAIPKTKIDATIASSHYPYGGYGRVIELLEKRIEFSAVSKNKIFVGYPTEHPKEENELHFLITAFEADKLPQGWVEKLNTYDVVIVPSKWCRELFVQCGVKVPVELMIQGTDDFSIVNDQPLIPFRFLHYNAFSDYKRKGWDLVTTAFLNQFGRYDKVELILKGRLHDNEKDIDSIPKRANIKVIVKNMNRVEMAKLQEEAHCFVFPSRGEGIGLPPIETMARGIPTIVTDSFGLTESAYFGVRINKFDYVDSVYPGFSWDGKPGQWTEPSLEQLEEKMFYVYRNYERVKREALDNAQNIKKLFNLDIQGDTFVDIITKYI